MYKVRLDRYIEINKKDLLDLSGIHEDKPRRDRYRKLNKKDLLNLSGFHEDKSLLTETLNDFTFRTHSVLSDLVSNEIFIDLFTSFKNDDYRFNGRKDLERLISITYIKYANFISGKIGFFYKDLSKLRTRLKKEKWKIQKIKRVPQLTEPIKITLDIRFAIIKKANGKCDGCSSTIYENPIEVYQLKTGDQLRFVAFCENCREKNIHNIQKEPEEKENNDQAI